MVTQARNSTSVSAEESLESRLNIYRSVIQTLMLDYAARSSTDQVQCIPVLDAQRDHYQVLDLGWDETGKRIFQPVLHIDIINDKIWIQENTTDIDLDRIFSASGIQPSEIVLGLYSPSLRSLGIYAIE
jgi:hypothetical protein